MEENILNEGKQEMEKKNEEIPTRENVENSDNGKYELNILEEAKKINEEMKKQNEIKAKLLEREEKLLARQETLRALGGGSPAGQTTIPPKVETAKEYAARILNGKN